MVKFVFDSCSLINLAKINNLSILKLISKELYIDKAVQDECVISGKALGYRDAFILDRFVEQNFTVIPQDYSEEIEYFGAKGEASTFLLGKNGICVTSDKKAFRKILNRGAKVIKIEDLFYLSLEKKTLSKEQFKQVINELLKIDAISGEKYHILIKEMEEWERSQQG
ncbi:MAG: hypothetical protein EAX96_19155 [Candidatus Lokiarchaeota archaeon]|nr:hypothetical protein [Candidatus Lokiarchaeota archaeon]